MRTFQVLLCLVMFAGNIIAQPTFTNASNQLFYQNTASGAPIGCADMNGDGLDDIVHIYRPTHVVRIQYQQPDGSFTGVELPGSARHPWSLVLGDVNEDGVNDILLGPNDNPEIMISGPGGQYTKTELSQNVFSQGANFADIDTDGDLDIFVCHDVGLSTPYRNDGNGNFTYDLGLIAAYTNGVSDNSGNYATIWTDYDNDGDLDMYLSRCRIGATDPQDPRRVNQLFQNDGNNNFTDVATAAGLVPYGQSWATDFADYDNDGDLDCIIINHDIPTMIYEQTSPGQFTDRTEDVGLDNINYGSGIQVVSEDFDNDGFQDIILTSQAGDLLLHNNGNFNFTPHLTQILPGNDPIYTAAVGDLNNDGALDMIIGRGRTYNGTNPDDPDLLLLNSSNNSNHFLKVNLEGTTSNIDGIGSRIEIYGAWGIQVREVRAGESYGVSHSLTKHFGLGNATQIDSVVVQWPTGLRSNYGSFNADQTISLTEVFTLTTTEVAIICEGDSITINDRTYSEPGVYTISSNLNAAEDTLFINQLSITERLNAISLSEIDVCLGDTILTADGRMLANILQPMTDTSYLTAANGCDSLVILNVGLFNEPNLATSLDIVICPGESVTTADGRTIDNINAAFTDTSRLNTINGCDSLVILNVGLFNEPNLATSLDIVICPGESIATPDGRTIDNINTAFTDTSRLNTINGCDSLVILNVDLFNEPNLATSLDIIVCPGESVTTADGRTIDNINAAFTDTSRLNTINGCDSLVILEVEVYEVVDQTQDLEVCSQESFILPDGTEISGLNNDTTFNLQLLNDQGCTFNYTLNVSVMNADDIELNAIENQLTISGQVEDIQWLDCNNNFAPIPDENQQTFAPAESGLYAASFAINGCVYTTECIQLTINKLNEPSWANQLKIYPIPTSGSVTVSIPQEGFTHNEQLIINIYNTTGKLLQRQLVSTNLWAGQQRQLDLPHVTGTYFIQFVTTAGKTVLRKVVVE